MTWHITQIIQMISSILLIKMFDTFWYIQTFKTKKEVTPPRTQCPECSMVASPSTFRRPKRLTNTWQLLGNYWQLTTICNPHSVKQITLTWLWHDIRNSFFMGFVAELPIHGLAMTFAIEKLRCQVLRSSAHCPCREIVTNASRKQRWCQKWNPDVISSTDCLFGIIF